MVSSAVAEKILREPFPVSDEQKEPILSDARYCRVIAGAGAGKTETITRRIAYLILSMDVTPSSIVAFTFTEKAAKSMKSRIYQRVEQNAGAAATARLGQMFVGTIHAYAKRVLDDYFGYGNWAVLDDNQETAYVMRQGHEIGIQDFGSFYADACRKFLRSIEMVQSELLENELLEKNASDFYKCYQRYKESLQKYKQLTFGSMICEVVSRLRSEPEKLSHVRHLIVDEYQDINRAQQEFIRLIGSHGSIFVVGDPRQSIYQWRGSDQSLFEDFTRVFPHTMTYNITENRRSGRRIVTNANRFADSFANLKVTPMQPARDCEGFLGLASPESPHDEARWIADQVEDIVVNRGIARFSDIGILTRSISTAAGPLISEFRQRRIPYIVGGKVGLFKRDEAQALGRIFAWLWDEGFWVEDPWRWGEQISGDNLLFSALNHWRQVFRYDVPAQAEQNLREIKRGLAEGGNRYRNFTAIYQDVLVALGFRNLDFSDPNEASIMANLGRFNNLLTDFETANRIGGRQPKWKRDLRGLCWFMNSYGLQAYEEQPSDDIRNVPAVQLMTIHQAKGLEWPFVFVFSLNDHRFPPRGVGKQEQWCGIPRDLFDAPRYEGSIEDERRLLYVAITRPREALILSYFQRMARAAIRSRFLDDMDRSVIEGLGDNPIPTLTVSTQNEIEELQTFVATEIIAHNRCPYMYLLRNLWGYQPGFVQTIDYGPALHYCLRVAGNMVRDDGYDPRTAVASAVDENFHMAYVSGVVLERAKNAANHTLTQFADKYGGDLSRIEEVEYRLEFPIQNATIMGRVDVLLRDMDELEVRDYKTSVDELSAIEAANQIRLYALGLRSMEKNVTKGSIADLSEAQVDELVINDTLLAEAKNGAEATVQRIVNHEFGPRPGESCNRCDYRSICRWCVRQNGT